jgi:hypothetical protein
MGESMKTCWVNTSKKLVNGGMRARADTARRLGRIQVKPYKMTQAKCL